MSYTTDRFAIRTVRNGRVKICGYVYRSHNMNGIERFEGRRMVFGRYTTWHGEKLVFEPFVYLWGEPSFFGCKTQEEIDAHPWPGIDCDENGVFSWAWWDRE